MNSNKSSPNTGALGDILTLREAAERLRVHKSTIYRMIKRGKLPHFRVGSDYRFSWTQIQEWIRHDQAKSGHGE